MALVARETFPLMRHVKIALKITIVDVVDVWHTNYPFVDYV